MSQASASSSIGGGDSVGDTISGSGSKNSLFMLAVIAAAAVLVFLIIRRKK